MSKVKNLELVHKIFSKYILNQKTFQRIAEKCKPIDGGNGRCVCEFTVEEQYENPMGTLHGGCTATLVDILSTVACLTGERSQPGVSVDLNISFLQPVKRGETVIIDAFILKAGKTLAFTQVDFRKKDDNSLVVTSRHTKAFPPDKK